MNKKFTPPKDFDVLELECDTYNIAQFKALGTALVRQVKSLDEQLVKVGRRVYQEKHSVHLHNIERAKRIATDYIKGIKNET